uniref:Uncharacterized protein n=1 Tax=Brassica campestris TaxID=3711 RepID=A0A3P6CHH0_BRACM|nr:unnamed protein product [Brassica rapa]
MAMDQLPKTLFKEGTETQVEKVNNTCRTSILKKVEKYVEAESTRKCWVIRYFLRLWIFMCTSFSIQESDPQLRL